MIRKLTVGLGLIVSFAIGYVVGFVALSWQLIEEADEEELEQFLSTNDRDVFVSVRPYLLEESAEDTEKSTQNKDS